MLNRNEIDREISEIAIPEGIDTGFIVSGGPFDADPTSSTGFWHMIGRADYSNRGMRSVAESYLRAVLERLSAGRRDCNVRVPVESHEETSFETRQFRGRAYVRFSVRELQEITNAA